MFNWLTEIEEPTNIDHEPVTADFKMRQVMVKENRIDMSPTCQLFAAVDIINGESGLFVVPTPDEQARLLVMETIAPHYVEIKETMIAGKVEEITLFQLKKESKRLIENYLHKDGYLVLHDLYRQTRGEYRDTPQNIKYYQVNKEQINRAHSKETEEVFSFFHATFFIHSQSILLQPTGWTLDDALKTSYTIRTFSQLAGDIVLWVNTNENKVIGFEVYHSKISLPIIPELS